MGVVTASAAEAAKRSGTVATSAVEIQT